MTAKVKRFPDDLDKKIARLSSSEQVALAKKIREIYVNDVRNTQAVLKPTLLRQFDAKIAEMERKVRGGR